MILISLCNILEFIFQFLAGFLLSPVRSRTAAKCKLPSISHQTLVWPLTFCYQQSSDSETTQPSPSPPPALQHCSNAASQLPSVTISDKEYFRECIMVRVYSQPGQKIQTSVDQIFSGFAEVQIEISWSMNDPTLYTHVNAVCSFRALLSHLRLGERWCPPPPPPPSPT